MRAFALAACLALAAGCADVGPELSKEPAAESAPETSPADAAPAEAGAPPEAVTAPGESRVGSQEEKTAERLDERMMEIQASAAMAVPAPPGIRARPKPVRVDVPQLTFIYSVNGSGYVDVCGCEHKEIKQGSLTRRSSFLRQIRATGRNILLLDGGSSLFHIESRVKEDDFEEAVRKAKVIVEAFNRMGYDAMAVGAFDLAAGIDVLKDLETRANFKFLSANLVDGTTGERYFDAHTVVERGGLRIGVLGLTLSTLTKVYLGKVAPNAVLTDPIEAARESFQELRDQSDFIIALSHLREEVNFDLCEELKGLEFLVDPYVQFGNHHTWIKEDEWLSVRGETVFLRGDGQGARLGVLDIDWSTFEAPLRSGQRLDELVLKELRGEATAEEEAEIEDLRGQNLYRFRRVSLNPHLLTDPDIDHLVEQSEKQIDPARVERIEERLPVKDKYTTHQECQSCHQKQYDFWKETTHAQAYATLRKTGDHERYDCLGCHTLGYGQTFLETTEVGAYGGVQCDSCHGSQPQHLEKPEEFPYGRVQRRACIICHNEEELDQKFEYFRTKPLVACPRGAATPPASR